MFPKRSLRVVGRENPWLHFRAQRALRCGFVSKWTVSRDKHFPRTEVLEGSGSFGRLHLGHAKFTRGHINVRHTCPLAILCDRSEVVVLTGTQKRRFGGGARRHNPREFPFYELLGETRIFHLIADRHAVTALNEPGDISLGGVIGNAAHGDGLTFLLVTGGQCDLKFPRGGDGIFVEELIEVTEPEHQQGIGSLLFDRVVLPHQRRRSVRAHA